MYAKNCARCGKLFSHLSGPPLCADCRQQDEEDYKRVKEYLYEHRGATMTEISEVLDVSISKIKRFLKEGRIEIIEDGNFVLQCERCGASIKSGQYCEACTIELMNDLKGVSNKAANKEHIHSDGDASKKTAKMRFLRKDNIRG
ncbi:MerR family transcriptional regulator [Petroclostridium sp. X23]|uniref:MerR family transcriptional regulator n=1 Tax=Petroclostridium sp. X23 TaxID=3045146 RepID=UPI0024AD3ED2|nr:MerR family transcriptional regulator [Petroclostridium sp. X23]WHH61523.1 MerR family transcriptional regulator [Petroclostridium sp. X23]